LETSHGLDAGRGVVVDLTRIAVEGEVREGAAHPAEDLFVVGDGVTLIAKSLERFALSLAAHQQGQGALGAFDAELLVEIDRGGGVGVASDQEPFAGVLRVEAQCGGDDADRALRWMVARTVGVFSFRQHHRAVGAE
jgi:hypothetical protein